jgi:hypothetical protein
MFMISNVKNYKQYNESSKELKCEQGKNESLKCKFLHKQLL